MTDEVLALLLQCHADEIPHPGGTLLAHLERVRATLAAWGAAPNVQLAGLCHASYGTHGFDTALLGLSNRDTLARAIGAAAEQLVYLYGSCDRNRTYPLLDGPEPVTFHDRFTGGTVLPDHAALHAFLEITAANELDVVEHNTELAERIGPWLHRFLTRCRGMISPAAWADCAARLAPFAPPSQAGD